MYKSGSIDGSVVNTSSSGLETLKSISWISFGQNLIRVKSYFTKMEMKRFLQTHPTVAKALRCFHISLQKCFNPDLYPLLVPLDIILNCHKIKAIIK
jgi:hypothetical protein